MAIIPLLSPTAHAANVSYWDMDTAVKAQSLDYAEQALACVCGLDSTPV